MKLIKSGLVEWPTREIKCSCGAVWEVEKSDLKLLARKESDQRGDTWTETYAGFECGECHTKIDVGASEGLINDLALIQRGYRKESRYRVT